MNEPEHGPVFRETSPGVEMGILRRHADQGLSFLIRMKQGARAVRHGHPGGEETVILKGTLRICARRDRDGQSLADAVLSEGQYLFSPEGEIHEGYAESDTLFFVVAAGGVVRTPPTEGDSSKTNG